MNLNGKNLFLLVSLS